MTTSSPKSPITSHVPVGLDVHKMTIQLACFHQNKIVFEHTYPTSNLVELRKGLSKLKKLYGDLVVCYEAGGAGFRLHRLITEWGHHSQIIAPSLTPSKPGDRRKCDKLDARRLAQYLGSGLLTQIHIPTEEEEAARDLVRARFATRKDTTRAKHRIVKMLDRKGRLYTEMAWTVAHREWLKKQEFLNFAEQRTFHYLLGNLEVQESQLAQIDKDIEEISKQEPYRKQVAVLRGFQGVDTLTAMVFITELGDIRRFPSPRKLMSYLGLIPKVRQSGNSGNTGVGITKAGNAFVRHVLNQASWKYLKKPSIGNALKERQKGLDAQTIALSWKAQKRLNARLHHLSEKRSRVVAIPAVSRELACFLAYALLSVYDKPDASAPASMPASGLTGTLVPAARDLTPTQ